MTAVSPEPRAIAAPTPVSIPVRDMAPWALFALALMGVMLYLVGAEQGASSLIGGSYVHEFVHDARHLLGFPCH